MRYSTRGEHGYTRFNGDRGVCWPAGATFAFRSSQYGGFRGVASEKGVVALDYYVGNAEEARRFTFVREGLGDALAKTLPARPTTTGVAAGATLNWAALSAGAYHTCGLAPNGNAFCWGSNARGQLGTGSRATRRAPARGVGPAP